MRIELTSYKVPDKPISTGFHKRIKRSELDTLASIITNLPRAKHFSGYYLDQTSLVILSKLTGKIIKPAGVFMETNCGSGEDHLLLSMTLPVPFAVEKSRVFLREEDKLEVHREFKRATRRNSSGKVWEISSRSSVRLELPQELENALNSYWLPRKRVQILRCLENLRGSMYEVTFYIAHDENALEELISARALLGKEGDYLRGLALGIPESAVNWFTETTDIERNNAIHNFLTRGGVLPASLKNKGSCWWEPKHPPNIEEVQLADAAHSVLEQVKGVLPAPVLRRFEEF